MASDDVPQGLTTVRDPPGLRRRVSIRSTGREAVAKGTDTLISKLARPAPSLGVSDVEIDYIQIVTGIPEREAVIAAEGPKLYAGLAGMWSLELEGSSTSSWLHPGDLAILPRPVPHQLKACSHQDARRKKARPEGNESPARALMVAFHITDAHAGEISDVPNVVFSRSPLFGKLGNSSEMPGVPAGGISANDVKSNPLLSHLANLLIGMVLIDGCHRAVER